MIILQNEKEKKQTTKTRKMLEKVSPKRKHQTITDQMSSSEDDDSLRIARFDLWAKSSPNEQWIKWVHEKCTKGGLYVS